jgi:hypothetical protein
MLRVSDARSKVAKLGIDKNNKALEINRVVLRRATARIRKPNKDLRRSSSRIIEALEAQEIKETGNEED